MFNKDPEMILIHIKCVTSKLNYFHPVRFYSLKSYSLILLAIINHFNEHEIHKEKHVNVHILRPHPIATLSDSLNTGPWNLQFYKHHSNLQCSNA